MTFFVNFLVGIVGSIIASAGFWYGSFKHKSVDIVFSPNIEKSKSKGEYPGEHRYRIRIKNIKRGDLLEVSMRVRLEAQGNYTYLGIGNESYLPLLAGKKKMKKYGADYYSHTLTLYPIGATYRQFAKSMYSDTIRQKAEDKKLSLDDIFSLGNDYRIKVYVFGNDSSTGIRKMFYKSYKIVDIVEGVFSSDKGNLYITPPKVEAQELFEGQED